MEAQYAISSYAKASSFAKASEDRSEDRRNTQYKPRVNIMFIIWSLGLGGAERVVINLAKGLDKTRYNPMVCCLNDKGIFANELEREGIKVIALNKRPGFDITVIRKLITVIRNNNIHIVHTHMWGANFWGRIAAKIAKVPVVIATEQNVDIWKKSYHLLFDRWLSRYTDKVIAVSNGVKEFYVKRADLNPDKIEVIYNSVDLNKSPRHQVTRSPVRGEFGVRNGEIVLAVIGRLVPQKGHRYFLLAFKELLNSFKIKGLIIGSGPLEEELRKFNQSLGLDGNIIFTGLRQNIPNLLKTIDILVLPSLREGLPLVVLEAMASGVPVVATRVGGTPEVVIDGQTGILVEPKNHVELKEAINRLLEDKNLSQRLTNNAKRLLEKEFSTTVMVNKTQLLYEEVNRTKICKTT